MSVGHRAIFDLLVGQLKTPLQQGNEVVKCLEEQIEPVALHFLIVFRSLISLIVSIINSSIIKIYVPFVKASLFYSCCLGKTTPFPMWKKWIAEDSEVHAI